MAFLFFNLLHFIVALLFKQIYITTIARNLTKMFGPKLALPIGAYPDWNI